MLTLASAGLAVGNRSVEVIDSSKCRQEPTSAASYRGMIEESSSSTSSSLIILRCNFVDVFRVINSLQCFDTVGWATGRASGL